MKCIPPKVEIQGKFIFSADNSRCFLIGENFQKITVCVTLYRSVAELAVADFRRKSTTDGSDNDRYKVYTCRSCEFSPKLVIKG